MCKSILVVLQALTNRIGKLIETKKGTKLVFI